MLFTILSLSIKEQLKLVVLGTLLLLERFVRWALFFVYEVLLVILGKGVLDFLYSKLACVSSNLSYELDSSKPESPESPRSMKNNPDRKLYFNTNELLRDMGIESQDYYVDTLDGFTLRLHRLLGNPEGQPVLLQHGLLMSDECFVFDEQCSLAKQLHLAGYDVWLGNNRGNKYSWKHEKFSRNDAEYWAFTIDEIARYDVPAMINCVLYFSIFSKINYIGFSNGCAQIFAAFQENPTLADNILQIIALAPAVKIKGLLHDADGKNAAGNGFIYPFFFSHESKLFIRCFGQRAWLPSVDQWKRIFTPKRWTSLLDAVIFAMFNWDMKDKVSNLKRRTRFYFHLYSTTSTAHVHHWMQLIGQSAFVGYRPSSSAFMGDVETMDYDFKNIEATPLTAFVGEQDNLIDVEWMAQTFNNMVLYSIPGYQHLDFLCHDNIEQDVYPDILNVLQSNIQAEQEKPDGYGNRLETPEYSPTKISLFQSRVREGRLM